jgi:hypothetical protein
MRKLLAMYGDSRFAALLRQERAAVRQSVIDSIDFAFEVYERHPDWSSLYVQTYAIAPHPHFSRLHKRKT